MLNNSAAASAATPLRSRASRSLEWAAAVALAAAQDTDDARAALDHEDVAVGGGDELARVLEALRVRLDDEALGHAQGRAVGVADDVRPVAGGLGGERRG